MTRGTASAAPRGRSSRPSTTRSASPERSADEPRPERRKDVQSSREPSRTGGRSAVRNDGGKRGRSGPPAKPPGGRAAARVDAGKRSGPGPVARKAIARAEAEHGRPGPEDSRGDSGKRGRPGPEDSRGDSSKRGRSGPEDRNTRGSREDRASRPGGKSGGRASGPGSNAGPDRARVGSRPTSTNARASARSARSDSGERPQAAAPERGRIGTRGKVNPRAGAKVGPGARRPTGDRKARAADEPTGERKVRRAGEPTGGERKVRRTGEPTGGERKPRRPEDELASEHKPRRAAEATDDDGAESKVRRSAAHDDDADDGVIEGDEAPTPARVDRLRRTEERLLAAADAARAAEQTGGTRSARKPDASRPAATRSVTGTLRPLPSRRAPAPLVDEDGNVGGARPAAKRPAARGDEERPASKRPAPRLDEEGATATRSAIRRAPRLETDDAAPRSAPRTPRPETDDEAPRSALRTPQADPDDAPRAARGDADDQATRPAPGAADGDEAAEPTTPGVVRTVRGWDDKPARSKAPGAKSTKKPPKPRVPAKTRKPTGPEKLAPARVRLQKVLAAAGIAARRKAEELITGRHVKVNGKIVSELGSKVDPERDEIRVDGKVVQVEKKVYFVLNKPDGVVCSAEGLKDGEGRPTVLTLLPNVLQRVYPIGRLDFHSRGVLFLTNDGDLAAALTHPRHKVPKTYHVKFQGRLDEAALAALGTGITLEDGTVTRPAEEVSIIKETSTNTWVQITLRQGLNRQIRRMGEALGHPVLKLIRVSIGAVTADGLADGEFRPLTPTEVYDLMATAAR